MREKLITDLKNLAQEILQLKEESEVNLLRQKSQEIFERLLVLDYLNKNNISSDKDKTEKEVLDDTPPILEVESRKSYIEDKTDVDSLKIETKTEEKPVIKEEVKEESTNLENIFVPSFGAIKEDLSQKVEFKDTVSLDETENLFTTKKGETKQLSLNDRLLGSSIQIGLNDRIAFVNKLFNFSQSEFNSELTVLNTFESENDAKNYIQNTLKRKYDWKDKEEIVDRFVLLVERKFL